MFETIGTLFTIAVWAVAIFLFGGGIIICIGNLIDGSGGEKFMAFIAIILGIVVFVYVYDWCESIVWSMLASGGVAGLIGNSLSNQAPAPQPNPGPDLGTALIDEMVQYQRDKEVVKNAIREYENEH